MKWNRIVLVRRDYSSHPFQVPDQKLNCIIKSTVQETQTLRGMGYLPCSRKSVLLFNHSLGKEILPNLQPKNPLVAALSSSQASYH